MNFAFFRENTFRKTDNTFISVFFSLLYSYCPLQFILLQSLVQLVFAPKQRFFAFSRKKCFSTDDIYRKTQTVLNTRRLTFLHFECLFFIFEKKSIIFNFVFLESAHFNFGILESGKWREIVWRRSRLANSTMRSASSTRITTERSGQRNWEQSSDTSDRIRQRRSFRYKIGSQL